MEATFLKQKVLQSIDKAEAAGFEIVPICINGAGKNCKVAKTLLPPAPNSLQSTCSVSLKLQTFFEYKNNIYFMLFCTPHIIKCIRNNLIRKDNYFKYPRLQLSNGFILEGGI